MLSLSTHEWARYPKRLFGTVVLLFVWTSCTVCLADDRTPVAQDPPEIAAEPDGPEIAGAPVEIDGRPIFLVYASLAGVTREERASHIEQRILSLARDKGITVESIHAEDHNAWTEIRADGNIIMAVTEGDSRGARRSRVQLANEYSEVIRRTVTNYRAEHTWGAVLRGFISTVITTVVLLIALALLFRFRGSLRSKLDRWVQATEQNFALQSFRSRFARYFVVPLIGAGKIGFVAVIVVLLQIYITRVMNYFPSTRYTALRMSRWTLGELSGFGLIIWGQLPNLVAITVVVIVSRYVLRLNEYLFDEIDRGTLAVAGFYPDWAKPTAKLVRLLIVAATAIVVFPYLPGSNSPAFRGISVFLGVLLSLGSTSAVAHGVAGTILTYMRSFKVGDFVRIGDTVGEVVEKTLLVTRILTQKKELVTVPNGSVLGGVVINYSSEARKNGVIFYTKVTIGYSAPWKRVHELLVSAALSTPDVLKSPQPFVLQSSLDDFYVCYELNAFTAHPENMLAIYSSLHQNIQDRFNEGGIEINSPHYTSLRDGSRIAMPELYVSKQDREPAFGIHEIRNHAGFPAAGAADSIPGAATRNGP